MNIDIGFETVAIVMGALFILYVLIGQKGDFISDMTKFAFILVIPVAIMYMIFKYMA